MSTRETGGCGVARNGLIRWPRLAAGALALLLAALLPGCGGGGDDGDGGSGGGLSDTELRLQFLQTVGNGFILPTYTAMEAEATALAASANAFCADPNQGNLDDAQDRWRRVSGLWVESELVKFGPATEDFVHDNIDVPRGGHADAALIEARIARGDINPDDPATARSLPVNRRGLEGIEYLLFGDEGDGGAMLDTADPLWERRCDFLRAIVDNLHANVNLILTRWQAGGGGYIDVWNSAGAAENTTYRFVQDAVQELMGEMEFVLDDLVNAKIAGYRPGARRAWEDGNPESWRSGNSIANLRHRVEAARMIYLGTDRSTTRNDFGIDDYLRQTGEAGLDGAIQAQFDEVLGATGVFRELEDLNVTLDAAVGSHQGLLDRVERACRELLRLLKRDLTVGQLDVFFPGFNDADGD